MEVCRSWVAVVLEGDGASVKPDTPTSEGSADFYDKKRDKEHGI